MKFVGSDPFDFKKDYALAPFVSLLLIAFWIFHLVYVLTVPTNLAGSIFHVLLQTFLSTGLFITAHDSIHGVAAPANPKLNRWIGTIAIFLYGGFSYKKLCLSHSTHHQNPGTVQDPDFTTHPKEKMLQWLMQFGQRYYGWNEFLKMHLHVAFVWLIGGALWKVFAFFALPAWLSAFQLFYFGTYLPHRTNPLSPHQNSHNARSNSMPLVLSLLTCYHFGYHLEHHEHPKSPWWTLPRIRFYNLSRK